jgi:hypothetical protein
MPAATMPLPGRESLVAAQTQRPKRVRSAISDEALQAHIRAILLKHRVPMSRPELVDALTGRGIHPVSKDPTNWLGTRLYRNHEPYVQIQGRGHGSPMCRTHRPKLDRRFALPASGVLPSANTGRLSYGFRVRLSRWPPF